MLSLNLSFSQLSLVILNSWYNCNIDRFYLYSCVSFSNCRVSADKLRRLSLAMADIENDIRRSNSFDMDNVLKCADFLVKYTGHIPEIQIQDEPPAYYECVAGDVTLLQSKQKVLKACLNSSK